MDDSQTGKAGLPASDASVAGRETNGSVFSNPTQLGLLAVGIVLLLLPVVVAIAAPAVLINASTQFSLRVATALGGALIGGFIPGALQVTLPWIKGAGALGLFALIYLVNPPAVGVLGANPTSSVATTPVAPGSTAAQLKKWIVPSTVQGAPTKIDAKHLQLLQQWTSTHDDFKNIPVSVFVSSDNPAIELARKAAIKDLSIPKPRSDALVSGGVPSKSPP